VCNAIRLLIHPAVVAGKGLLLDKLGAEICAFPINWRWDILAHYVFDKFRIHCSVLKIAQFTFTSWKRGFSLLNYSCYLLLQPYKTFPVVRPPSWIVNFRLHLRSFIFVWAMSSQIAISEKRGKTQSLRNGSVLSLGTEMCISDKSTSSWIFNSANAGVCSYWVYGFLHTLKHGYGLSSGPSSSTDHKTWD